MQTISEIPLRYNPNDQTSSLTPEALARTAAGFGQTALAIIEHLRTGAGDAAALDVVAAEARAAGHYGLLALERTPAAEDVDPTTCDILIENHGSLFLFRPRTRSATEWLRVHTGGQWFGAALVVEPRYAGQLVCAIEDAGLVVR